MQVLFMIFLQDHW